jgi:hypothetical protein
MVDLERRTTARMELRLPVRFCAQDLPSKAEEIETQCIDVSRGGLLLESPCPLRVGSKLAIKLSVPADLSRNVFSQFNLKAVVIHEQRLTDEVLHYGVKFDAPAELRSLARGQREVLEHLEQFARGVQREISAPELIRFFENT